MKEIPVTFKNQGQKIFGVLHLSDVRNPPAVILCHGFTGYNREVQLVNCARKLCENGYAALRFDFRGSGYSDGKFSDMTISSEISDLKAAIDFLQIQKIDKNRIGVIGHSLGGAIAILCDDKRIKSRVLWAPPIRLRILFEKLIGKKLVRKFEKEKSVKFGWNKRKFTFELGRNIWNEIKNFNDITDELRKIMTPTLVIYGDNDEGFKINKPRNIFSKTDKTKELKIIKGADHVFGQYLHEQKLINLTVDWFNKWLK